MTALDARPAIWVACARAHPTDPAELFPRPLHHTGGCGRDGDWTETNDEERTDECNR